MIILVAKDTKDEAYFWSSRKKELQMRRELENLRKKLRARKGLSYEPRNVGTLRKAEFAEMMAPVDLSEREQLSRKTAESPGQRSLPEYDRKRRGGTQSPLLAISNRLAGTVLEQRLREAGFGLKTEEIESADVVVSERIAIAIRTVDDFIEGMSDGSMLSTLSKMRHQYLHPILIVQGPAEGKGVEEGNAAVYDVLGGLLSDFRMPILSTTSEGETVAAITSLMRQERERRGDGPRTTQTKLDDNGRQLFLIQGLPNVSATLAQRLLERFGSVKAIADAKPDELMQVDGVGRVIAEGIHTVMRRKFREGDGSDG